MDGGVVCGQKGSFFCISFDTCLLYSSCIDSNNPFMCIPFIDSFSVCEIVANVYGDSSPIQI